MRNNSVHISKIIIGLILVTAFQGCASLSKEECQGADWTGIGYRDGSNGLRESRFNDHQKACAEYKVTPDYSAYLDGRARGLEQVYCKARSGYYEGLYGRHYGNVCPQQLEADFLAAYNYGHHIYDLQQDAIQIREKIESESARVEVLDEEIDQLRHEMKRRKKKGAKDKHHKKDESNSTKQHDEQKEKPGPHHDKSKKQLRREIRAARRLRDKALHHLDHLDHQLHQLEDEIRHLRSTRPYR